MNVYKSVIECSNNCNHNTITIIDMSTGELREVCVNRLEYILNALGSTWKVFCTKDNHQV